MQNLGPSLATLVIVIAFARLVGFLFRKLGQPPVMGEVLGGILLGPSVIGYFFPASSAFLFHGDSLDFLKHIAEVGICLYLFVMGLEIDLPRLRKTARSAILISQMSIVLPFGLGLLLAQQLYSNYAPAGFGILEFSLFIGVALSITAFPVLARILADSSLHKTRLGDLALTCAAIDDITAWCLLAIVTGITGKTNNAWTTIVLTIIYVLLMLAILRPILAKAISSLEKKIDRLPEALLAFAILGALTSAVITDVIGIHALFGAFLFGVIIPHESLIAKEVTSRLQDFIRILFLPAFFALTGMKTQISLISSPSDWLICAIIIAVAILGKFGGAYLGATLSGNTRREATILGVLMNTRGLVELIVLNIGLSLGILTPTLFTMLVLMALVTTFMAGPLLRLAGPYSEK
ncbi:MAG: cation:proton antiporter [Deltaproteobacteria bacterium]|jgi:Kef-type K+ transport system membrane component KefB|nr:cation:proton antiporter [Deltaproteobacteria bacterium]